MKDVWVIRAGRGGVHADEFEQHGVIAIGFLLNFDISSLSSRDEVLAEMQSRFPNTKRARLINAAGQLFRFVHEINEGDLVLTPISDAREIMMGEVTGPYRYEGNLFDDFPHVRSVSWSHRVSRDALSAPARNSAGSSLTLFSMNEHREEIQSVFAGERPTLDVTEDSEEAAGLQLYEEVRGKAEELISDKIAHMDPFDFEELVAALLRAMGYYARRTEEGPDRGVDVIAHPDALGINTPRIKVQVKQRFNQRVGSGDIRNFIATLRDPDRGLFISTGGFSREALYEAERVPSGISLTTLDRDQFVELLTEHYDRLEPDARAMIPLKRIFIPIE